MENDAQRFLPPSPPESPDDLTGRRRAAEKAKTGLLALQEENGRFEGRLTSNAYPTLACMLIRLLNGRPLDEASRRWLVQQQAPDGRYPLDPEGRASDEAARFARVVLQAALEIDEDVKLRQALEKIPPLGWNLWLVKAFGALAGQYEWRRLIPPWHMALAGRVLGGLSLVFPKALFRKIKPPMHLAPPVSLHRQRTFKRLFAAEQYTLAPMLLLIEAHTRRRPQEMKELTSWALSRQAADGSWFCVAFITAVAAMALQAAQRAKVDERIERPLERALKLLDNMRNPAPQGDGGTREAASLNVWDTSLAVQALLQAGVPARSEPIETALEWLEEVQNVDGGWAFHGLRGRGLPSDADDTALAAAALMTRGKKTLPVQRAVEWLRGRQAPDGSWSTYAPGAGDVGCVSVTAHALETMLKAGETQAAKKGVQWLHDAQNADGSWDDLWIAKKSYGTGTALTAMARTGFGDAERIRRAVEWLRSAQREDGGWGETQLGDPADSSAEQTAAAAQALLAHGENADAAVQWLLKRQRNDGGWDPSPVGIYWEVIGGYANPMNAWVFPLLALTEPAAQRPYPSSREMKI